MTDCSCAQFRDGKPGERCIDCKHFVDGPPYTGLPGQCKKHNGSIGWYKCCDYFEAKEER